MFKNFKDIEAYILTSGIKKRVVLACAQDDLALEAVVKARKRGVISAVLIGDLDRIRKLLEGPNEPEEDYELIFCPDEGEAGRMAVSLVNEGMADIPMKGLMMTSSFMKAILDKEKGFLKPGRLLNQATVLEYTDENRMMIISDCAVNIAPTYEDKIKITQNCIELAHELGIEKPNIAFLSALEKVNPKIQSTVDADALTQYANAGGFKGAGEAFGPVALDIAVDAQCARHKGVHHPVCGHADILIVPDLASGNIFTKSLTFFAHLNSAGTLNGTTNAVIMTSRTDTPEDKYDSILTAVLKAM